MSVKYQLWKVTYDTGSFRTEDYTPGGEFLLFELPTLDEMKQCAKDNLQIGKSFWKRNIDGDLYATNKHEVCHYTIDEIVTED